MSKIGSLGFDINVSFGLLHSQYLIAVPDIIIKGSI